MGEQKSGKGKVVIISGPSGVGKSTICREAIKRLDNASLSVSVTTRPKAEAEVDGRDYWFISRDEFQRRIDDDMLLEYAEVFGHLYGTPKDKVDEALRSGKTIILEIDVQGAEQAKAIYPDAETIFILPPSVDALAERMNGRGREDAETAKKRLDKANNEITTAERRYEHKVINDDLQQAVNEVVQIIDAASHKHSSAFGDAG
ncbi:MAG: guanylate kinase [Planctomycetota bacterium]|nr:MAG: guanylate kinase [Planctomycetota bacterium]